VSDKFSREFLRLTRSLEAGSSSEGLEGEAEEESEDESEGESDNEREPPLHLKAGKFGAKEGRKFARGLDSRRWGGECNTRSDGMN